MGGGEGVGYFLIIIMSGAHQMYNSLKGMCLWMGSCFHDWTDYNGVAFSIEFNTRTRFRIFRAKTVLHIYGYC